MKELGPFSPADFRIVTLRAQQGAPDDVIATEIEHRTGAIFSAEEISEIRERFKLPPPDPNRALAASVLQPGQSLPVMRSEKPAGASAAFARTDARSNPLIAALEDMLAQPRQIAPLRSPPAIADPAVGGVYMAPVYGLVTCASIDETEAAGYKLRVARLVRDGAERTGTLTVPVAKFKEKNIREPATPDLLDDVLYRLRHGGTTLRNIPAVSKHRQKYFQDAGTSGALDTTAGLIHFAFAGKKTAENFGSLITAANDAVRRLSEEYAHVKGVDRADAVRLIERAVGKASQHERDLVYQGRAPRPAGPQPS